MGNAGFVSSTVGVSGLPSGVWGGFRSGGKHRQQWSAEETSLVVGALSLPKVSGPIRILAWGVWDLGSYTNTPTNKQTNKQASKQASKHTRAHTHTETHAQTQTDSFRVWFCKNRGVGCQGRIP